MRLISGNLLKTLLLILMSIALRSSLPQMSYVLMSPYHGGHWINLVFLMYVAMDRKPEIGSEIHTAACRRLGIIMRLSIVYSARN